MKKYTFTDGGYTFQRIDKKAARRAYNNGLRVMLCPVNLRPGYPLPPGNQHKRQSRRNI